MLIYGMLPVTVARSSFDDNAVTFSHKGANGAELKVTLCLVEFARWRHQSATKSCAPRAKCVVPIALLL